MRISLHHSTKYTYDRPVTLSPHVIRLRPAPHTRTTIEAYSLRIVPEEHFLNWQQDPFGNYQARLVFPNPTDTFAITVDLIADLVAINPFDFFLEKTAETFPQDYDPALKLELTPYFHVLPKGPRLAALVDQCRTRFLRPGRRTMDVLVDINQYVQSILRYDIRMEPGVFTPEETLEKGHGSCRDFAWLQCQVLRHFSFATRFASGYSIQLRLDEKPVVGPAGVERDVADLHAWTEVFLPGAGWVGLDATSGLLAGEGHIPLACTPEPGSAAPVTGTISWNKKAPLDTLGESFTVTMTVNRIAEAPRSTKPYADETWQKILALGRVVDQALNDEDVRLTMGGEPTFVSASERDAPEWNTAALGGNKFKVADSLARRLHEHFAKGGLLFHGQGKWYPGEPLPRWAIGCYWRRDGVAIWDDPTLLLPEDGPRPSHGAKEASTFIHELARRLSVENTYILPAYEDTGYHLWRERRLPVNVDPLDNRLDDEQERARLAKIFDQGLSAIVGYALPLAREFSSTWHSGPWFLRREHLFLLPGDSPMGFRLPLDSLPWVSPEDRDPSADPDPTVAQSPLPARVVLQPGRVTSATLDPPSPGGSAKHQVRTALCVEPRHGLLHIFFPPMPDTASFLELVATVEGTAAALGNPVRLEGYPPSADPRLVKFDLTPDPGVLEVNVQPSRSFDELMNVTTTLYTEARAVGLSTEKFDLDGRHSGTGGGNHITLGGYTPADSPLLRRPDLLRSLLGYWNNHPSLSYFFSGLFIGPTSQAPRIDEARHDTLAELDIAFRLVEPGKICAPWLVDRLFRHLLADATGNTHRAEFCIDKLYSPDTAQGRQGILELRNFEMPPHARMSLAQQLLVRALVAMMWKSPLTRPLVRWGTTLHDRFMLPHFIREDFTDVVHDLCQVGFPFEEDWFRPHYEFRFPLVGAMNIRSMGLEIRRALEPWHVLAEQGMVGGTARNVDSSLERLQVLVTHMTDTRYMVLCNGRRLPMTATGTSGEYVAGVRFRAWQPPECLHPTIPVHAPLVFDIHDTWSGRSIGGCTYYVSHPGGMALESRPMNALVAESRRKARFLLFGHSPGTQPLIEEPHHPLFPLTLDLRC